MEKTWKTTFVWYARKKKWYVYLFHVAICAYVKIVCKNINTLIKFALFAKFHMKKW